MRKKIFKHQVGVLFSDEIYKLLIKITDAEEVSLSQLIREIVEERLNQYNNREESKNDKYQ